MAWVRPFGHRTNRSDWVNSTVIVTALLRLQQLAVQNLTRLFFFRLDLGLTQPKPLLFLKLCTAWESLSGRRTNRSHPTNDLNPLLRLQHLVVITETS